MITSFHHHTRHVGHLMATTLLLNHIATYLPRMTTPLTGYITFQTLWVTGINQIAMSQLYIQKNQILLSLQSLAREYRLTISDIRFKTSRGGDRHESAIEEELHFVDQSDELPLTQTDGS